MAELTTADLLLEWDATRPRSLQMEMGMSDLGTCRRKVKYRLLGTRPTNRGSSVQAVMGTAAHDAVKTILLELQASGRIPAADLVEYPVTFAGIPGHLDRYESASARVRDTKTTTQRWLDKVRANGPSVSHLWQVHGYAAGLITQGRPVRQIVIDYLARDTGEEYTWRGRFDPEIVRQALDWVQVIRDTDLEFVARDFAPDSPWCRHCPFRDTCWAGHVTGRAPRSVLYVEHPDAAAWARKLADARARKERAVADEAEAKGALDALRPNDDGTQDVIVPGFDRALRYIVTSPTRLDGKQVRADYAAANRSAPMTTSETPTVRLELVQIDSFPAPT